MKVWAWVILAGIIVAAIGASYRAVYSAGYNARDVEVRDEATEAQNKAIQKGIDDWIETQDQAEAEIIIEEKIVKEIQYVDREIPKVVETIKYECRNLNDATVGVLNKQVAASNSAHGDSPNAPAPLVN